MQGYSFVYYLLFFYLYCFIGWCYESTYVSILQRRFINRGFLRGPYLPIYGCGAITVLLLTSPFCDSPIIVFFLGMILATLIEYLVGTIMESIFKVRYWDYSDQRLNYKGYICLSSSITWGVFSVVLINFMHNPIESLVLKIPSEPATIIAFVITILFFMDVAMSVNSALDIRSLLIHLVEDKIEIKIIRRQLMIVVNMIREEKNHVKETNVQKLTEFYKELKELKLSYILRKEKSKERKKERYSKIHRLINTNPSIRSLHFKEVLEELKEMINHHEK